MLTRIQTKSAKINIVPDEILRNPSLQIFSADSMSLIIGPNGSGKTRILSEIVAKVLSADSTIEGDDNPYNKTLVIYYTPIPYHVDLPAECAQFIDLQQRARPSKTQRSHFSALQAVAKFFDFSPQLVMSFNPHTAILRDIQTLFAKKIVSPPDDTPKDIENAIKNADQARIKAFEFRNRNSLDYISYINSIAYENIQLAETELEAMMAENLLQLLGDHPVAKLIALQEATKIHNRKLDIIQAVLESKNFKFDRVIKQYPKTALATYTKTLNILLQICQTLKTQDIPTSSISIDHEAAAEIGKFNYSRFATISLRNLSAGGHALINQFMKIEEALRSRKAKQKKVKNLLLLIDEGDVFLHLTWQQKYVKYLNEYIARIKATEQFETVQVILTTHSPVLMSDFPNDCIIKLKEQPLYDLAEDWRTVEADERVVSFGAPLQTIINKTGNSGTIGEFAADFMKKLVISARQREQIDPYHVQIIDDPIVRSYLEPALKVG